MKSGPGITTDGLVFGYDTGEFSSDSLSFNTFMPLNSNNRNFKGAEARNYIAGQNAVRKFPLEAAAYSSAGTFATKHPNDIKAYDINGNRLQTYVNTGVTDWTNTYHAHWQHDPILNKPVVVMEDLVSGQWKAKSFGSGLPSWNTLGLTHGSKYTISWLQWVDNLSKHAKAGLYRRRASDNANNFWDGQASSATSYNTKLRTWQRVYHTFTTNSVVDLDSTYLSIYMYGHYSVRATVKVADVQIDLHDHPTSYQEFNGSTTERSSTQGLIDLTGNTTIDTNNISFSSYGFTTFDGTGDKIQTPLYSDRNPSTNTFTVEAWVKSDITSGNRMWVDVGGNGTNQRFYCAHASVGTGSVVSTNQYTVLGFTFNGSTCKIFKDGVNIKETTTSSTADVSGCTTMGVGKVYSTDRFTDGKIPLVRVYNKTLTDEEVKQNFNAYKKRFGL